MHSVAESTKVTWDPTPFLTRHLVRPVLLVSLEFAAYMACVLGAVLSHSFGLKLILSLLAGVLTATLAIISHDAGHRGGIRYRWLNRLIGTIGFLPALHPLSRWEHHHNQIHHRYTAQIGLDNAYSPMTVEQYRAASPARQLYYRFLRSGFGQPIFYLFEVWLPKLFLPGRSERSSFQTRDYIDIAIVYLWLPVFLASLTALSFARNPGEHLAHAFINAAVFGFVVPFLVWNLFISFVTVVQHTGPGVKWSKPSGRPSTPEQKMRGTVRILFPEPIDLLFHRTMQHTAHHLNAMIPLYSLKSAQRGLEDATNDDVITVRWTPAYHMRIVRSCKLYDPDCDGWCDFEFRATG